MGEVKREALSFSNTYLEETPDKVIQMESRELTGIRRIKLRPTAGAATQSVSRKKNNLSVDNLQWQDNSRDMYDRAVADAPFYVRLFVRRSMLDAVIERADSNGRVSEDVVIDAVRATTPEKFRGEILAELEQMKSR